MSKELPNNEEVDLGQLFKLIAKGFASIATGIKRFFNGILNSFISFALFVKKHAIKIVAITIIGLAFGFYKDYTNPKVYSSSMLVKLNYNATKQLYNEIASINNAFLQDESKAAFIKEFGLTKKDVVYAEIAPVKSNKIQLEIFDKFIKQIDTTTIKDVDFKVFVSGLADIDYPKQKITVKTTNPKVFSKINKHIIANLNKNTLLLNRVTVNLKNIAFKEAQLHKALENIDSLRVVYNKSLLAEANKPNSGTTIITAKQNGNTSVKELALYDKRSKIINELNYLSTLKIDKKELIQIVSDFSEYGNSKTKLYKTNTFKFGLIAFLFIVLIILFTQFMAYLNKIQ